MDKNDCRSMSPINMNRNLHPFKVCFTAPEDVGKQAKHLKYISTLISIECINHISYAEVGEGDVYRHHACGIVFPAKKLIMNLLATKPC